MPTATPTPFEDADKDLAIRKEREMAEPSAPETEADTLLDELRRGTQEPPPDYDQL